MIGCCCGASPCHGAPLHRTPAASATQGWEISALFLETAFPYELHAKAAERSVLGYTLYSGRTGGGWGQGRSKAFNTDKMQTGKGGQGSLASSDVVRKL